MSYASLFQTAFTKDLIPQINDLLLKYKDHLYFDGCLWKDLEHCNKIIFLTKSPWSIGMKGLRGKRVIHTFGHNEELSFLDEKYLYFLEKMIGKTDTEIYMYLSELLNIKQFDRVDKIYQSEIAELDKNLNKVISEYNS